MCDGYVTLGRGFSGRRRGNATGKVRESRRKSCTRGRPPGAGGAGRKISRPAAAVSPDESRRPGLRRLAEERPEDVVRLPDLVRSASSRHEREDLLRLAIVHGPASVEPDVGQRGQRHVERDGHPVEAVDGDGLLAALDLADELPAEVRPVAESLLTETPLLTQGAQPLTEKASNLSGRS